MGDDRLDPDYASHVIAVCQSAVEDGRPGASPPDEPLYHSTAIETLLSIVENKTLRASLVTTTNDASEVIYSLGVARSMVRERGPYETRLLEFIEQPWEIEMFPLATCFCETADSSSQWLNYGRRGRGVAIGFRARELVPMALAQGFELRKIDYDADSQRQRIGRVIDEGRRALQGAGAGRRDPQAIEATALTVAMALRLLAVELKHPAFENEREWRLVGHQSFHEGRTLFAPKARTLFRAEGGTVNPYGDIPFETLDPIESVVVGHSSAADISAVKLLLLSAQSRAKVSRSGVAVR
jgi:hypothetical protein